MKSSFLMRAAVLTVAAALPGEALAQASWTPGAEVIGQPILVTTNGVTNTVYLDAGGRLRILTPAGKTIPGQWTAANGQLCLGLGGAQECVPYSAPFQAGQPLRLTSSCNATETWLAEMTNSPPPGNAAPERGR